MYRRYILKLLFVRFFAILFCFVSFGIFQEIAKGKILKTFFFEQLIEVLYLLIPFISFQFLPFVYFLTLFIVIMQLYLNNEIFFLKTSGASNKSIINIFFIFACIVCLFASLLAQLYPYANLKFYQKKNIFTINNILKQKKPDQINKIGKYELFFKKIDQNNILHNATVFLKKNNTIIYSDEMLFEYDKQNRLLLKCKNLKIFPNKNNDKQKYVAKINYMEFFFHDFFDDYTFSQQTYKQTLRQMNIKDLLLEETQQTQQQKILKKAELHNRMFIYWFIILTITSICCLLIKKSSNRVFKVKSKLFIFLIGLYLSTSHSILLVFSIKHNILLFYYPHFVIICVLSILSLTYNEIFFNIKKILKKKYA